VGPRAVLDAVVKRKIPNPLRESNPKTSIDQPVAQRHTDWAIMVLIFFLCKYKMWSCPCALNKQHAMKAYWGSGGIAPSSFTYLSALSVFSPTMSSPCSSFLIFIAISFHNFHSSLYPSPSPFRNTEFSKSPGEEDPMLFNMSCYWRFVPHALWQRLTLWRDAEKTRFRLTDTASKCKGWAVNQSRQKVW
jgi:hypothetical protein